MEDLNWRRASVICSDIFTDKLLNKETYHLDLFFNDEWEGKRNIESYGHDIEASNCSTETALVLDDKILLHKIERIIRRIADAADEGLRPDGSMVYEHWKDGDKYISSASGRCSVRTSSAISTLSVFPHRRNLPDRYLPGTM